MDLFEARRLYVMRLIDGPRFNGKRSAFCDATGISASYLTRMLKEQGEKAHKRIGDDLALKIEGVLNITPGDLLHPVGTGRAEKPATLLLLPSTRSTTCWPASLPHPTQPAACGLFRVQMKIIYLRVLTCPAPTGKVSLNATDIAEMR